MEITREKKELVNAQRREFDDLQNEIAGRETGRRARFLRDGPGSEEATRKERAERRALTRLVELLNDPVYRAKYDGVMTTLRGAEQATETALQRITRGIEVAEDDLADIQDRAARLPDGTRVYQDADGILRREDGSQVDDVLAATVVWSGNEPNFEDYRSAQDRLDVLSKEKTEVEIYRDDVLGPARDQVTDEDAPASLGGLDDILDDIETQMPHAVRSVGENLDQGNDQRVPVSQITLPKLGGD